MENSRMNDTIKGERGIGNAPNKKPDQCIYDALVDDSISKVTLFGAERETTSEPLTVL